MLADCQPAYPMSCFFMLKLRGRFDVSVFTSALQNALANHPLLTSIVIETKGKFYWQNTGTIPVITRLPLDEECRFPAAKGIDLFREPALNVTLCNNNTDPAAITLDGQTNIIFEVHHSACDAAGIARFIEDIFCTYAQKTGFTDAQREAVHTDLLLHRGIFGQNSMRTLPKQLWGLTRAWMFLLNRVMPLASTMETKPSADYPAIIHRDLTPAKTQNVLQTAKQFGITLNDLFLCSVFFAMKNWQEQQVPLLYPKWGQNRFFSFANFAFTLRPLWLKFYRKGRRESTEDAKEQFIFPCGYLRIAVPTNLRTSADILIPAANIVSMVFLDRKPQNIRQTPSFYQGICREMQHIKRYDLGWAFIHGLTLYRRIFGSFRKMVQQNRCWTTATVSNLGRLFADIPLPKQEGRIQIDKSLELIGIETAPPIRAGTTLGISMLTYADGMTVNLHYDSNVLTRSEAQSILDDVVPTVFTESEA